MRYIYDKINAILPANYDAKHAFKPVLRTSFSVCMFWGVKIFSYLKNEIWGGWVGQDQFVKNAKFKKIENYESPLKAVSILNDIVHCALINGVRCRYFHCQTWTLWVNHHNYS